MSISRRSFLIASGNSAAFGASSLLFPRLARVRGRQLRRVTQLYFAGTDAGLLAQDKVLQHDLWGKTNPLPSNIFAQPQKHGSTLEAGAAHYTFDVVL